MKLDYGIEISREVNLLSRLAIITAINEGIDVFKYINGKLKHLQRCLDRFQKLSNLYARKFPSRPPQIMERYVDLMKTGLIRKEALISLKDELRAYRDTGYFYTLDSYEDLMYRLSCQMQDFETKSVEVKPKKEQPHFRTLEFGKKKEILIMSLITIKKDIAFIINEDELTCVDISQEEGQTLDTFKHKELNDAKSIHYENNIVYVSTSNKIISFFISDPIHIRLLKTCTYQKELNYNQANKLLKTGVVLKNTQFKNEYFRMINKNIEMSFTSCFSNYYNIVLLPYAKNGWSIVNTFKRRQK